MSDALRLIRDSFPDRPAFGTAVSEAILMRVAAGELGGTVRLHRPGPELAFSKQDAASPGFSAAVAAARGVGFEPVLRLAGGRAAVFHEGTLALARATPAAHPARTTRERFEEVAATITAALRRLGVDARIGEVPGEYCPGAFSVNAGGRLKLAGIGQRLIKGAAHVGCVIVAGGGQELRSVLAPVYEALEIEWDPATAGSVDEVVPGVTTADVEAAVLAQLGDRFELAEVDLDPDTLALAERLEPRHRAG